MTIKSGEIINTYTKLIAKMKPFIFHKWFSYDYLNDMYKVRIFIYKEIKFTCTYYIMTCTLNIPLDISGNDIEGKGEDINCV